MLAEGEAVLYQDRLLALVAQVVAVLVACKQV
jgi:hypothetical protein